ncbi:MAG: hypothetical protein GX333_08245 [Syntrophomonadaceae bacterium]|nr:hypothetical protein [Syntrophomonadaceae bacterium]
MDASKALAMIRRLRHDFGNHLQVIGGYTELGYAEEVQDYIAQIVREMNEEKILFELDNPELSLFLLQQKLYAQEVGVMLNYQVVDITTTASELIEELDLFAAIKSLVGEQAKEEVVINVSIYELVDQVKVVLNSKLLTDNFKDFYIKKR